MGNPGPLFQGRLGGADIHVAVHLHGIGVDDFPLETLGQADRLQVLGVKVTSVTCLLAKR